MDEKDKKEESGATAWFAQKDNPEPERYLLRLYVTGTTANSIRAIANLKKICEEHLPDGYDLEVIDLYQQPHLASSDGIIAVPTLVKRAPMPLKRIVGDMSDTGRVLHGLNLDVEK